MSNLLYRISMQLPPSTSNNTSNSAAVSSPNQPPRYDPLGIARNRREKYGYENNPNQDNTLSGASTMIAGGNSSGKTQCYEEGDDDLENLPLPQPSWLLHDAMNQTAKEGANAAWMGAVIHSFKNQFEVLKEEVNLVVTDSSELSNTVVNETQALRREYLDTFEEFSRQIEQMAIVMRRVEGNMGETQKGLCERLEQAISERDAARTALQVDRWRFEAQKKTVSTQLVSWMAHQQRCLRKTTGRFLIKHEDRLKRWVFMSFSVLTQQSRIRTSAASLVWSMHLRSVSKWAFSRWHSVCHADSALKKQLDIIEEQQLQQKRLQQELESTKQFASDQQRLAEEAFQAATYCEKQGSSAKIDVARLANENEALVKRLVEAEANAANLRLQLDSSKREIVRLQNEVQTSTTLAEQALAAMEEIQQSRSSNLCSKCHNPLALPTPLSDGASNTTIMAGAGVPVETLTAVRMWSNEVRSHLDWIKSQKELTAASGKMADDLRRDAQELNNGSTAVFPVQFRVPGDGKTGESMQDPDISTMDDDQAGIGVTLRLFSEVGTNTVAVARLSATGMARRTGALKVGDRILEIDGHSTINMSVRDASALVRGPEGSNVNLVVHRVKPDSASDPPERLTFTIQRSR